jgi:negative regulator of replication initiation
MRTHQVEIDDDIFAFVKSHSEPLVDTFNSSLRRLLALSVTKEKRPASIATGAGSPPTFPGGTPQSLQQIIEVALLVHSGSHSRPSATKVVAKHHQVAGPTVQDKYARQLGLSAHKFDRLLEQPGFKDLKQLLHSKFAEHCDVINRWLR